jgi:hypothetical protein
MWIKKINKLKIFFLTKVNIFNIIEIVLFQGVDDNAVDSALLLKQFISLIHLN